MTHPPPPSSALELTSIGFALLFAVSAAVQLNDPDWGPWFAFYVACAVVAAGAPRWRHGQTAARLLLIAATLWGVAIFGRGLDPITAGELLGDLRMKTENVELWREGGGLVLTALWMAVLSLRLPRP